MKDSVIVSIDKYKAREEFDPSFQNRQALRVLRELKRTSLEASLMPNSKEKSAIERHIAAINVALKTLTT